jgi:predicted GNAT family acetyltransferase
MKVTVIHNAAASRFEASPDGHLALCSYRRMGDVLVLHHTEVPDALAGQGVAAALVQAALDWARAEGLKVRPTCSYVAAYMRRHPETQDLLAAS